jgi:Family of unknown function (DUF6680)
MTIADWLMIGAVLLAPLIAVQVQKWLEYWREKRMRKINVYKTLMSTRAARLDPSHVTALNMIDLEFQEKPVIEKWREYMDCLGGAPQIPPTDALEKERDKYQNDLKVWSEKYDDKFIDLLYEMGHVLKYKFDKVHLKKAIYHPQGLSNLEMEQQIFRKAAISFLSGHHAVNMNVTSVPSSSEEVEKVQTALRQYALDLIEGKRAIPVAISTREEQDGNPRP